MAPRDYVKKKNKPKNNSRLISNFMMLMAVMLVALFAAILYFVSTNKPNKPVTPIKDITEAPTVTLPDKPQERWTYLKELENPNGSQSTNQQHEKERQQILDNFMNDKQTNQVANNQTKHEKERQQILDNFMNDQSQTNQVVTNQTQQPIISQNNNPSGQWTLQCGAFKDKSNAESLKAKLAMLGITSSVKSEQLYRVIIGPYNSKADAERAISTLKDNGVSNCIIPK